MHLSNILTSLAVIATASAGVIRRQVTTFETPGFGNLPQINPNATKILEDLTAVDNAVVGLTNALASAPGGNTLSGDLNTPNVITMTITLQSANRQSMLDAQELVDTFSSDDSAAVLKKIRDEIVPHAQAALNLLSKAKQQSALNAQTSKLAILPYLQITEGEYDTFVTSVLPYIDPTHKADVEKALKDLRGFLTGTVGVYTGQ